MKMPSEDFVPALGWEGITGWYGFICAISGLGSRFKKRIVESAYLHGNERIADIGSGDGTFLNELHKLYPNIVADGVDPDAKLLHLAKKRLEGAEQHITLLFGTAQQLPQPDASIDSLFCTLTLHHLSDEDKKRSLREMLRVLKPGGRVHVTDFGPKRYPFIPSFLIFENKSYIESCLTGMLPTFLQEAGFSVKAYTPFYGNRIWLLEGAKPLER